VHPKLVSLGRAHTLLIALYLPSLQFYLPMACRCNLSLVRLPLLLALASLMLLAYTGLPRLTVQTNRKATSTAKWTKYKRKPSMPLCWSVFMLPMRSCREDGTPLQAGGPLQGHIFELTARKQLFCVPFWVVHLLCVHLIYIFGKKTWLSWQIV